MSYNIKLGDAVSNILNISYGYVKAWSHRQWIIRTLNNPELWSLEIEYSHTKVLSDPRNNSAWNQRWFALHEGKVMIPSSSVNNDLPGITLEKAREETQYALSGAKVDPYNESPWRYLIGIVMEQWRCVQRRGDDTAKEEVATLVRETIVAMKEMKQSLAEEHPTLGSCVSLLSALVDLLELFTNERELLNEAKGYCDELILEDPVRRKYWLKRGKVYEALQGL